MKTIKPTTKVIVAVVAAVLVAMLIAGIIVGILYYFNSNTYLFRMSAFEGEYVNETHADYKYLMTFSISSAGEKASYGCRIENGKCVYERFVNLNKEIVDSSSFDENVFGKLEYFAKLFNQKCVVENKQILFDETNQVATIIENKYISHKKDIDGVPERLILCKMSDGPEMSGSMLTTYNMYNGRFRVTIKRIRFTVEETVFGSTGEEYNIAFLCLFLNKIELETKSYSYIP